VQRISRHRGADPEDERSFGTGCLHALRQATGDLCWLLDHGYGIASATELVGDRHHLTRRQRIAIARCACSREDKERRKSNCVGTADLRGQELWLDGFNVLTVIESALGGGVILIGEMVAAEMWLGFIRITTRWQKLFRRFGPLGRLPCD
jgi:hypothetical protein